MLKMVEWWLGPTTSFVPRLPLSFSHIKFSHAQIIATSISRVIFMRAKKLEKERESLGTRLANDS
jgi:hypothetical protein